MVTVIPRGRLHEYGLVASARPSEPFWLVAGNAMQTIFDGGTLLHLLEGTKDTYNAAAWSDRGTVITAD
jgi:hypothetical protein